MKTIVIWDTIGEEPVKFFVLQGNYRDLDKTYINAYTQEPEVQEAQDELFALVFNEDGTLKVTMFDSYPTGAILNASDMDTAVITAGFLP